MKQVIAIDTCTEGAERRPSFVRHPNELDGPGAAARRVEAEAARQGKRNGFGVEHDEAPSGPGGRLGSWVGWRMGGMGGDHRGFVRAGSTGAPARGQAPPMSAQTTSRRDRTCELGPLASSPHHSPRRAWTAVTAGPASVAMRENRSAGLGAGAGTQGWRRAERHRAAGRRTGARRAQGCVIAQYLAGVGAGSLSRVAHGTGRVRDGRPDLASLRRRPRRTHAAHMRIGEQACIEYTGPIAASSARTPRRLRRAPTLAHDLVEAHDARVSNGAKRIVAVAN